MLRKIRVEGGDGSYDLQPRLRRNSSARGGKGPRLRAAIRRSTMKKIGGLSLVTLACTAAMAIAGATPAAATQNTALCKVNTNPCPAKSLITSIHWVNFAGSVAEIKNSIAKILCLDVLVAGTVLGLATAPAPQQIHVTGFTFGKCGTTSSHDNCTLEILEVPLLELLNESKPAPEEDYGTLTAASGKLKVKCTIGGFLKIDCDYKLAGMNATFAGNSGGSPATVLWFEMPFGGSESLLITCPASSSFSLVLEALEETHVTT